MMKIFLYLALVSIIFSENFDLNKYKQEFDEFCSGINKHVCTNEFIEFGMIYFHNYLRKLESKIFRKRKNNVAQSGKTSSSRAKEGRKIGSIIEASFSRPSYIN